MIKKKRKRRRYFTEETQDAIVRYNNETSPFKRNQIYEKHIRYAFEKLAENILNTFKFSYFDSMDKMDIQHEVVSNLIEKIHMYKPDKGRAFSYFSIVAKNYLILLNNNNYGRFKKTKVISEMPEGWNVSNDHDQIEVNRDYKEYTELLLKWWDSNLNYIFIKKRDIQIADAVLELLRRSENIENFKKKHLYLLVREMVGCKTYYITKIVNVMKEYHEMLYDEYLTTGDIQEQSIDFWENGDDD